jgi:hypothetical protein
MMRQPLAGSHDAQSLDRDVGGQYFWITPLVVPSEVTKLPCDSRIQATKGTGRRILQNNRGLAHLEVHDYDAFPVDGVAISVQRGLKPSRAGGLHRRLVQPVAKSLDHLDHVDLSIG